MPTQMTVKERWLAAVEMRPLDRLPFWPKLDRAYPPSQRPLFSEMAIDDIHRWIGSDRHIFVPSCVREVGRRCRREVDERDGERRITYHAPSGECEELARYDPVSCSWHPSKHPVETREDIRIMTAYYDDLDPEADLEAAEKARAALAAHGEDVVIGAGIGESPLMRWVEWIAGVEKAHLLLADHKDDVEELFRAMHRLLLREVEIAAQVCPADLLYLVENTSTTLISPTQYQAYCLGHIREYGEAATAAGRRLALHMCGRLKALLPDVAGLPVAGFEAFTSPPIGDTTLIDGRTLCPDKCLIGGSNAALWMRPAGEIIEQLERDLDALPHHRGIVVTSGGVMPPAAGPETIRDVCEWVKTFPARM